MGKIKQGILGGFSGKVGPVIGTSWKGKAVIKARALSYNDRNSLAQQEQRAKFTLLSQLLAKIVGFVRIGFAKKAVGITAPNAAMAANIDEAVSGAFPQFAVDFEHLLVANGTVDLPYTPTGDLDSGTVTVTYADNTGRGDALADDKVMLLLYSEPLNQAVYNTDAAVRSARTASIDVPSTWTGTGKIHAYLAMRRESTGQCSPSVYIGNYTA